MSDAAPAPVSALDGAVFEAPDASIRELGAVGMLTIRGDFASKALAKAVEAETGCAIPAQRRFEAGEAAGLGWMSPDELLLVCDYSEAPAIAARLSAALEGEHHLVLNVSDARAAFEISGSGAREALAKGAPVDMSPDAFAPGDLRRTRLGQVAAAFWISANGGRETIRLVCFRSVASYVFDWLGTSCVGSRPRLY